MKMIAFEDKAAYVRRLQDRGIHREVLAEKTGAVMAHKAAEGEIVECWNGSGKLESQYPAKPGEWIVSAATLDGKLNMVMPATDSKRPGERLAVAKGSAAEAEARAMGFKEVMWAPGKDAKGRDNFERKYDVANMDPETGFAKPNGGEQRFIQVPEDVTIKVPWGEHGALVDQIVHAGGYLNITNPNDIYGIDKEDFATTYRVNTVEVEGTVFSDAKRRLPECPSAGDDQPDPGQASPV